MTLVDDSIGESNQLPVSRSHVKKRLFDHLSNRYRTPYCNYDGVYTMARDHPPFLYHLNLMKKLPVHMGCVNTITWNKTGEYILSGSDDCNLCITKPTYMFDNSEDYTVLHKIQTRHLGNIFGARFLPNQSDSLIVSCSSDGPVIVHDINLENPSQGIFNFNCHASTIFDIETLQDDDKVFLSCGDDKTIRLFDLRCHRSCARSSTCPHPSLIRNSHAMTTLSIHPSNSNLVLVGRADGIGLVYDRRRLPDVSKFSRERAHAEYLANQTRPQGSNESASKYLHPLDGVVSQFTVPDMEEKCRFTSLCYSSNGEQVLASYSQDYVYLFNTDRSSNFDLIQTLPRTTAISSPEIDVNVGERSNNQTGRGIARSIRTPRIRVRGDWSDTGIYSVPQSARSEGNSNQRVPSFLQRMTEVAMSLSQQASRRGSSQRFFPMNQLITGPINYAVSNDSPSDTQDSTDQLDDDTSIAGDSDDEMEQEEANQIEKEDENENDDSDNNVPRTCTDFNENINGLRHSCPKKKSSGKTKSCIRQETKLKFKRTIADLKNKYNNIPTYHPRVRYQGHRNSRTFIKKAIFWGDNYIMSGSDCGRIMVWEKETAKLVMSFPADERVVNCLASNPHHYALASSGIDHDIKIWSTQSIVDHPLKVSQEELDHIVKNNELMLEEAKQTIAVPPHLFFRVLASYAQNRLR